MKNLIEGEQPESLKMHYTLNYNHSINNSKQDRLVIPFYQTKIGTSSLLYQGCKLWNDIPFVLKSKPYKIFAKELKKTLSDDTHHTALKLDSIYLLTKGLPISLNHDLNTFMAETLILKLKS